MAVIEYIADRIIVISVHVVCSILSLFTVQRKSRIRDNVLVRMSTEKTICTVPFSVEKIGHSVFGVRLHSRFIRDCRRPIKLLIIPRNVKYIGAFAFNRSPKIECLVFLNPNTQFEHDAFYGSRIDKIFLPDNMRELPRMFFSNSCSFDNVFLPKKLEHISSGAFSFVCAKFHCCRGKIKVDDNAFGMPTLAYNRYTKEGELFLIFGNHLAAVHAARTKTMKVPEYIEEISSDAFVGFDGEKIILSERLLNTEVISKFNDRAKIQIFNGMERKIADSSCKPLFINLFEQHPEEVLEYDVLRLKFCLENGFFSKKCIQSLVDLLLDEGDIEKIAMVLEYFDPGKKTA